MANALGTALGDISSNMSTSAGVRTRTEVPLASRSPSSWAPASGLVVIMPSVRSRPSVKARTTTRFAPARRSRWVPVPLTPPSMHRRSPIGCGGKTPGTALLAATARAMDVPVSRVRTQRSAV